MDAAGEKESRVLTCRILEQALRKYIRKFLLESPTLRQKLAFHPPVISK